MSTSGPVILITGANSGLGLALAKTLLSFSTPHPYHVILACRSPSSASATAENLHALPSTVGTCSTLTLDVTSDSSISAAVSTIRSQHSHIDILINNAGVYGGSSAPPPAPQTSLRDGLATALAVNVTGAAAVSEAFLPLLRSNSSSVAQAPKLVFVTTSLASFAYSSGDVQSRHRGPFGTEYRASKAALNMLLIQLAASPAWEGVDVLGVDPGFLATDLSGKGAADMLRGLGAIEPEEGARDVVKMVLESAAGQRGRVVAKEGVVPW